MKKRTIELINKKIEHNKVLTEMIEKILFEEGELNNLKHLINDLQNGKIHPKQLRAAIIEDRAKMLNKIIRIFPYYHRQITYQEEIEDFTEKDIEAEIKKELEEKKELLKRVGNWVKNTRNKIINNSNL